MKRPNILFILADDLGWCDLGAGGSRFYESPHIDRIAAEGMRFTRGYAACQVCSPSRASILTGQYPPRHGITNYIGAPGGEAWRALGRGDRLLPPAYARGLDPAAVTFPEALRRAGYRTFFAGKWHVGDEETAGPGRFGFEDFRCGFWRGGARYFGPWPNASSGPGAPGDCLAARLAAETAHFIADHRREPFLAYLSFHHVHSPIQTTRNRWEKYRRKASAQATPARRFIFDRNLPVRQVQDCPVYAGMIEAMDEAVGLLLRTLDECGLADDTLVCFTSDNGGVSSGDAYSSSMLPLRGGKGRQWEGGIREPLYIRCPGLVRPGSACEVPVSGIDLYPTFMELAGQPLPPEQHIDGRSFLPLLAGRDAPALAGRDLFWHYPHYGNQGGDPSSIISRDPWKLIHYHEDGRDELYHLGNDPGEQHNVAAAHPREAAAMRARLDRWLREVGATFPTPDPEYNPDRAAERRRQLKRELMPALEAQHAAYLDPAWQPDDDWWGSQVVND